MRARTVDQVHDMKPQATHPSTIAPRRDASGAAVPGSVVQAVPVLRAGNLPH
jgi:hypothetical protein